MQLTRTLLFFMLLLGILQAQASQERKVMIIGIDGTRSDALQQANTPNIDALIANGLYSWDAYHLGITVSAPSWSDIMCGVWEAKHGVTNNSYSGSHYAQYPYFTTRAKEVKPNLYCVQVTEWAPMSDYVYNDSWNKKLKVPDGLGLPTVEAAWSELSNPNLDAMFVYFDKCDLTGHSSGFSPGNPSYITAIEFTDSCVGLVIDSLKKRPTYAQEDWLILLITDHGGIGTGHGGNSYEERHIWWIASGNSINHGQIFAPDPGTYQLNNVDTAILAVTPVQADIGVTALHHLIYDSGINPEDQPAWNLDGKSWLDEFVGIKEEKNELDVKIYPNPSTGLFTFWFANQDSRPVKYEVRDMAGRIVKEGNDLASVYKMNVDLADQEAGNYLITVHIGDKSVTKSVVLTH